MATTTPKNITLNTRLINRRADKTWNQIENNTVQLYNGEILLVPVTDKGYAMRIATKDTEGKLKDVTKYLVNPDVDTAITTINQTLNEITGSAPGDGSPNKSIEYIVKKLLGSMKNDASGVVVNFAVDDDGILTGLEKKELSSADISDWDTELAKKLDASVFENFKSVEFQPIAEKLKTVSRVLNFKGVISSDPTDTEFDMSTYAIGDVVIFGNMEYVCIEVDKVVGEEVTKVKKFVDFGDTSALSQSINDIASNYVKINENKKLVDQDDNVIILDGGVL